jgi:hypothetical protein
MRLDPDNRTLFFGLYYRLLAWSNQHTQTLPGVTEAVDIPGLAPPDIVSIRDALYDHPELIESFVKENPAGLGPEHLAIVAEWRHFIKGAFCLLRQLKQCAIFLPFDDPSRAFGVLALGDTFENLIRQPLPAMVDTVLLPFRGVIIADGFMVTMGIVFGGGYRQEMTGLYETAKARYGVITSLPFEAEERQHGDAEMLLFYLKSEANRDQYWDEIQDLVASSRELRVLYHQEMGKIESRRWKKHLREWGITRSWFASYGGAILASGATREETMSGAQRVVPADRHDYIYLFEHKPK